MNKEDGGNREPIGLRYDFIDPAFIKAMAEVSQFGCAKYDPPGAKFGGLNWQLKELTGDKAPMNHAMKHMVEYMAGRPDDEPHYLSEFNGHEQHLIHAAYNLMFEAYYQRQRRLEAEAKEEIEEMR